jgi:para-aminobenzoate synthetase component 1
VATSGSVKVPDLCTVVSFPNVHQMISTVTATLHADRDPYDALVSCFPPASMTGAPKIRAMQLISEAEWSPRGLFSGSLGFFAPDGTGDFNVVIRTVVYNAENGSLSLRTGSAITARCEPAKEWDECTLKARSVMDTMGHA